MAVERTLSIIKPDAVAKNVIGKIYSRFETNGLKVIAAKMVHLSRQEAEESTRWHLSYYEDDVVVVDWDAALLIDEPRDFDETLYIMELANLQLAELEEYYRILDNAL